MTDAARGLGRNHALRLAREAASVIGVDVAADVSPHSEYLAASEADLKETTRLVEAEGRSDSEHDRYNKALSALAVISAEWRCALSLRSSKAHTSS